MLWYLKVNFQCVYRKSNHPLCSSSTKTSDYFCPIKCFCVGKSKGMFFLVNNCSCTTSWNSAPKIWGVAPASEAPLSNDTACSSFPMLFIKHVLRMYCIETFILNPRCLNYSKNFETFVTTWSVFCMWVWVAFRHKITRNQRHISRKFQQRYTLYYKKYSIIDNHKWNLLSLVVASKQLCGKLCILPINK